MVQSESIDKIYPALIKALGELTSVQNNAENTHFKTKYSTLSATQDIFRPVLAKHDLGLIQSVNSKADGKYRVITKLIHTSGQFISDEIDLLIGQNTMQGLGSAITYSKRYMAQALLNMSGTNDDDDGNDASAKGNKGQNNQNNQRQQNQKPQGESKPHQSPSDVVYPFESSVKGKKIGEIETATLGKASEWLKGELAKEHQPKNIKQIAFIYAQVKAVLKDREIPTPPPDDIPENINPSTGEVFPPDDEQLFPPDDAPTGPSIDDYMIPKGVLAALDGLAEIPLKKISEKELREVQKILDAEMRKGPKSEISATVGFEIRNKITEFFKSMGV